MIVKVQLPLMNFGAKMAKNEALIYDKKRKHQRTQVLTDDQVKVVRANPMAGGAKTFFHAEWNGRFFVIGLPAPDQTW